MTARETSMHVIRHLEHALFWITDPDDNTNELWTTDVGEARRFASAEDARQAVVAAGYAIDDFDFPRTDKRSRNSDEVSPVVTA